MPYSVFVGVALTIHVLISADMFIKKDNIPAIKNYRWFFPGRGRSVPGLFRDPRALPRGRLSFARPGGFLYRLLPASDRQGT